MQELILRKARHFAIFSTCIVLTAFTTSAQAAAFRTTWDPLFDSSFSAVLGWRGSAVIDVDDACVGSSTIVDFPDPAPSPSCGTATLESYELIFYDVGGPPMNELASLMGSAPLPNNITAVSFDAMSIADGFTLDAEINAGVFIFGSTSYQAFLDFHLPVTGSSLGAPSLRLRDYCGDDVGCDSFYNDSQGSPPIVAWSRAPAPASLALFGIGLAALGLMRRPEKA